MTGRSLVQRMRDQRWHLDGTWAEEWPNGDLIEEGAEALERAHAALAIAREALERCYNVTTYPASGESPQDKAIAAIDAALSRPAYRPQDGEGA